MTITTLPPAVHAAAPLSRMTRRALAFVAFLGPIFMACWTMAVPYAVGASIPETAAAYAAQPGRVALSLLFLFLACTFATAGSLVVAAAIRRGAPRMAAVAAVVAFIGFSSGAYPGPVAAIAASRQAGMDVDQLLRLIEVVDGQPLGLLVSALFVGVPAGILLLGIGAVITARRGAVPVWAAVLLVVAAPAILAGGFIGQVPLAAGWVLAAVGYGALGWVYAGAGDRTTM